VITKNRWEVECLLMAKVFPQFQPFSSDGSIGFRGSLRGSRTGQVYEVFLQAPASDYPLTPPSAYVTPHPEPYHWEYGDKLSFLIHWIPNKNTFASIALIVVQYINEFDGNKEKKTNVD